MSHMNRATFCKEVLVSVSTFTTGGACSHCEIVGANASAIRRQIRSRHAGDMASMLSQCWKSTSSNAVPRFLKSELARTCNCSEAVIIISRRLSLAGSNPVHRTKVRIRTMVVPHVVELRGFGLVTPDPSLACLALEVRDGNKSRPCCGRLLTRQTRPDANVWLTPPRVDHMARRSG